MFKLIWLVPALPLFGFLFLTVLGSRLSKPAISYIGAGSVGLSALVTAAIAYSFITSPPDDYRIAFIFADWMNVAGFNPKFGIYLDALAVVMIVVITFVGFLIHVYSTEYMGDDDGYARFFAYMNLFMSSMLILVLADNLLFLYLGWEGVGLSSYLLIGFWYTDPENDKAAIKAFLVTRVGDAAFAVGLFLLFFHLGTLNIQEILLNAPQVWAMGSFVATAAALLLLVGAVGKSAQLPLQVWLPDAMAGPTPVSALIHAATMVTAGVYLIARMNGLYILAPIAQSFVAYIGMFTLLLAGFSAIVQTDLKRALAYSTISQIGYMFLALGVDAWSGALFHFANHAFFKALLFLAAGAIINSVHHEQDMLKMGGLRKQIPLVFWVFLIGASALAALPFITNGFYSKDLILWHAWASPKGNVLLWAGGIIGAVLTGLYAYRMVFLVFFGEAKIVTDYKPGPAISIPLVILAFFSIFSGFIQMPEVLGQTQLFTEFTHTALPVSRILSGHTTEAVLIIIASAASLIGLYIAYKAYIKDPQLAVNLLKTSPGSALNNFFFHGWGFDFVYYTFIVDPFTHLARAGKNDVIDYFYQGIAYVMRKANYLFGEIQTGNIRNYAMGLIFGALLTVAALVFS